MREMWRYVMLPTYVCSVGSGLFNYTKSSKFTTKNKNAHLPPRFNINQKLKLNQSTISTEKKRL